MDKAIKYAQGLCDTMMRKFEAQELPPAGIFHYHQGVFLSGMLNTYEVCKDERYYSYIKKWVDSIVYEDGTIHTFREEMLDDIQPGILLIYLYERTKDEKYKTALETLMKVLRTWPTNPEGGFWHKLFLKNQMWLDGLYMAAPLEAQYSAIFKDESFVNTAVQQIILMWEKIRDKNTNLLYHAWDYDKTCEWADKETGVSEEVWGRALGWYVVAVLDVLEYLPQNHPQRERIIDIERKVLEAVKKYQDKESGMWYQVVDKGEYEDNWTESSCTALFSYAFAKSARINITDKTYTDAAKRAFEGLVRKSVRFDGEDLFLNDVCIGTNVCDYKAYISRDVSTNDLHGAGAFLLMCAELGRIKE